MAAELQGEQVLLRPVRDDDVPALVALARDSEVARWWGRYDEARMRKDIGEPGLTAWTVWVGGEVAGLVYASEEEDVDHRLVELDIFVSAAQHGRGLGADALRTALRWAFGERGHHLAIIGPAAENERAIRSYERLGFRRVGVVRQAERAPDGRWRDMLLMDMLAGELR